MDFFTAPTNRLRVLFVFLVMEHEPRRVLHFGITEHPTAEWSGEQMIEAFAEGDAKRYLIRDRNSMYGHEFRGRVQSLGMKGVVSAQRSPWQTLMSNFLRTPFLSTTRLPTIYSELPLLPGNPFLESFRLSDYTGINSTPLLTIGAGILFAEPHLQTTIEITEGRRIPLVSHRNSLS